jgi:NADPH:quinone reductase-like Zn-dependent oxidoreductase
MELDGETKAVVNDVRKFKAGAQVSEFCGVLMGYHAECKCMPEDGAVAFKPPNLTYEEAAVLPAGGTTALDFFSTFWGDSRKASLLARYGSCDRR